MKIKNRTKYVLLKDLPGCPKGTEFWKRDGESGLYPNGISPKGDAIGIPFDSSWFKEGGRAEEFTREEMIRFTKACLHSNTPDDKIEETLSHLESTKLMGRQS